MTASGQRWERRLRVSGVVARLAIALASLAAGPAFAQGFLDEAFVDPTDGAFDVSNWLLEKRGFLPVPIIVTEPAVGYGGGAALLFFHRPAQGEGAEPAPGAPEEPLGLPPSVSFGFGFGTASKSWGAGGGHFGTFRSDRIRSLTVGGYATANVDLYIDGNAVQAKFPYTIQGGLVSQELLVRLFRTDLFVGSRYRFSVLQPSTPFSPPPPFDQIFQIEKDENAGLSVIALFDSRDNIFTPNRGQNVRIDYTFWRDFFGGDNDFDLLESSLIWYQPFFDEKLVVGVNLGADFSFGDAPFYMEPYVKLRGVPALRYQDERAWQGELELRWRVWRRLSLIGFAGVGWIDGRKSDRFSDPGAIPAGGFGFRYLMARLLGMHSGVDFGFAQDSFAFYIQTGSAW